MANTKANYGDPWYDETRTKRMKPYWTSGVRQVAPPNHRSLLAVDLFNASELHESGHMTTGHRLFCKEFLCFGTMPCRPMPSLMRFWRSIQCMTQAQPVRTVDFRNFIVFFWAETLAHFKSDIVSKKHPQLICSDLRLSNWKFEDWNYGNRV